MFARRLSDRADRAKMGPPQVGDLLEIAKAVGWEDIKSFETLIVTTEDERDRIYDIGRGDCAFSEFSQKKRRASNRDS